VPLNDDATRCSTKRRASIPIACSPTTANLGQVNVRAIKNFRGHDLRHVWATWQSWPYDMRNCRTRRVEVKN